MGVWTWELIGRAGQVLDRPASPEFGSRFDAESWLGESWRVLSAQGVASVRLLRDGRPAAAPLSLPETDA